MFTNTETGETIQDKDYAYYYKNAQRTLKVAAAKAARLIIVDEDRGDVAEVVEMIGEDVQDVDAFKAYIDAYHAVALEDWVGGVTLEETKEIIEGFEDVFAGTWQSERDYTEEMITDGVLGEPSNGLLAQYVDVESLTRDLFISDFYSLKAPGGLVWVFHNV